VGDKLIFELARRRFALHTDEVDKVVEVERLSYLPGQNGIVSGVISLVGEPVTVVDVSKVFSLAPPATGGLKKVVVVRRGNMTLGLDIGPAPVTFAWEEDLEKGGEESGGQGGKGGNGGEVSDAAQKTWSGPYVSGTVPGGEETVEIIDWPALFKEAARILSSEGLSA
jgi:hypothetical protein